MSMQKDKEIPGQSPLAALPGQKIVVGAKQLRKALTAGTAKKVFLAKDADPAITEPIVALCKLKSARYSWVESMTCLGRACGIEVSAAAAAVISDSVGETP